MLGFLLLSFHSTLDSPLLSAHPSMAFFSIRILLSCRTLILSPLQRSPLSCFPTIHFSTFSSHTLTPSPCPPDPQNPHPPLSLFLLTECQFSPSQISKIMKTNKYLLKTKSPHTAQDAVEFLKQWGFTQPQIHTTILKYPDVLQCKVDTRLKPKFYYFRTLGFTDQEISNLISICPRVLSYNLESNIIPRISFLENLVGTKPNLIKVLKRSPSLLLENIEKSVKPKLSFLKQWGIQDELLSLLLSTNSNILVRYSIESLRVRMEFVSSTMGIGQGSKKFAYAIRVLLGNTPQNVEKKMKNLQALGLLEDEVLELLKKNPSLLTCSTSKMQENMGFLTQTVGLEPNVVFSKSYLLKYNVTKRLMPRHAVFKALSSEQQSVRILLTIFRLTERDFLQKIVECNPQASMLKEIYKGKMESADIGTSTRSTLRHS